MSAISQLSAHMACRLFSGGRLTAKKSVLYNQMWLSLPPPNEFYEASKAFLKAIYIDLGIEERSLILDQLLLPSNAWRMERYFDESAHCIIANLDSRDVSLLNKYVWSPFMALPCFTLPMLRHFVHTTHGCENRKSKPTIPMSIGFTSRTWSTTTTTRLNTCCKP